MSEAFSTPAAPKAIGPYSQAVRSGSLLFTSGQLPLDPATVRSVAVIGPNADQVQFGDYAPSKNNADGVSVLRGIRELVGDRLQVRYAKGCALVGRSTAGFAEAVEAARQSDVAVVVIGDTSMILSGVGWEDPTVPATGTVGEGFDVRASMGHVKDLPKSALGIDVKQDFTPTYQVIETKKKNLSEITRQWCPL